MAPSEEHRLIKRINELSSDSLDGAIERGQILKKLGLDWHEYESKKIGISFHTGYRLIALAEHPRMQRSDWVKPALWTVCYELLQMSDKLFDSMLAAGFVNHHTTRRQARDFVKLHRRNLKPIDSKLSGRRINTRMDRIFNEDCFEGMKRIADGSVDLILSDLPYGMTENVWDSIIPLDLLWVEYKRILKPEGTVVLTAQGPFTIKLGASNLPWYRYEWIWQKTNASGFLNCGNAPLRSHENVLVFAKGKHTYNPQMEAGKPYIQHRNPSKSTNYNDCKSRNGEVVTTVNDGWRYPKTVLQFGNTHQDSIHPTQKPVALFEYLIRTYTNPGELVLDNCLGSGTTAIAAMNSDRRFIGFELNEDYFKAAQDRIKNHVPEDKKADLLATMFEEVS